MKLAATIAGALLGLAFIAFGLLVLSTRLNTIGPARRKRRRALYDGLCYYGVSHVC
ncbi:MAG: hypothetical protein R3F19_09175 [Verrucomicrobiales bacterium]